MAKLISLYGRAQCGKGEAARSLIRCGWHLVKFAGPIKAMLRHTLLAAGVDPFEVNECIEGSLKEVPHAALEGKSPRHAMQTLGTEWGRECIGKNLWVNLTMGEARQWLRGGFNVVIDDMRFYNEYEAVRKLGGRCVHVERIGQRHIPRADHESEGRLDLYPMTLLSAHSGELEKLRVGIHKIAEDTQEVQL